MKMFKGYDLENLKRGPVKEVGELSRKIAAEGIILLKNEDVLPFDKVKNLAIFGRTQIDYVRSGTGSGGLVDMPYSVNILDGLKDRIDINKDLLKVYEEWLVDNPFDKGAGWAQEPWAQKEMEVSEELCEGIAKQSDAALVVIGRTAGEEKDNSAEPESYLLSETEEKLIETVTKHFKKVCVALNTGNIIDMKWVEKYNVPCVLYCHQGGQEGGNAFADVVLGDVSPSGRLTDTIAYDINDYPSTAHQGSIIENAYVEDIYVGYRYFETFAKDKVLYPFGYGLSYTDFECAYKAEKLDNTIKINVTVKNIGAHSGKTVVQVYYSAPNGELGKPARQLIRFKKTKELKVNESEEFTIEFSIDEMASYDDTSRFAYILEKGEYKIYAGENVRDAKEILAFELEEKITQQLRQVLAATKAFDRFKNVNGEIKYEATQTRQYDLAERTKENITSQIPPTGNKGITLADVKNGKNTLDEFINQLSYFELACLVRGEGMNSPKVTAGTGSCFGGVTDELLAYGIPLVCCSDGPSGIRMNYKSSQIPSGTCIASSWNEDLLEELMELIAIEMRASDIDILLAPGINIHRNPLCGRNFEYYSEDPYLAGRMAAAYTRGLDNIGVAGTIKHFACNSQELGRATENSLVSERAIREIYLKPFEIAVKEGRASALMTSYNGLNGLYTSTSYDLTTSVLRDEWGYTGIVMTDWWTLLGEPDGTGNRDFGLLFGNNKKRKLKEMVIAQNDLYMVTKSAKDYMDNIEDGLEDGTLALSQLRLCAKNILSFILTSPAYGRKPKNNQTVNKEEYEEAFTLESITANTEYDLNGIEAVELEFMTEGEALAQYIINVLAGGKNITCALTQGAVDAPKTEIIKIWDTDKPISFEFASAFKYMKLTAMKKK